MKKSGKYSEMFKFSVLAAIIAVALPDVASADTLNTVITNVAQTQLKGLPYILSIVCYVGGAFMLVSGALSLKRHAENPSTEPMNKGIARLIVGGAITSVPALTGVIQRTVGVQGKADATYSGFSGLNW